MLILTYDYGSGRISEEYKNALIQILAISKYNNALEFKEVDQGLAKQIDAWVEAGILLDEFAINFDTASTRLIIANANNIKLKEYCLSKAGNAQWGCCISESIAIEYAPQNKSMEVQIHESLHLFGVDECYEKNSLKPKSVCNNKKCVMRYDVPSLAVCHSVKRQIMNI